MTIGPTSRIGVPCCYHDATNTKSAAIIIGPDSTALTENLFVIAQDGTTSVVTDIPHVQAVPTPPYWTTFGQ